MKTRLPALMTCPDSDIRCSNAGAFLIEAAIEGETLGFMSGMKIASIENESIFAG